MIKHDELQYIIVDKNNMDSRSLDVTSKIYAAWFEQWQSIFSAEGRNFSPNPDDFLRQDLIVGIFHQDQLVGFHLYSHFDLRRTQCTQHSYFHSIDPSSFDQLRQKKLNNVMTMEYLTVMPNFRRRDGGGGAIPWGEVIISLGQRVLKTTHADVAFGTARRDVKVNRMGSRIGFSILQNPIVKYDYECEVMYFTRDQNQNHPDPETHRLIASLWDNRIDTRHESKSITKAA